MKSKAKVLAQLTSLQHLLELKVEELEGPESTTSLEQDIQILEVSFHHKKKIAYTLQVKNLIPVI